MLAELAERERLWRNSAVMRGVSGRFGAWTMAAFTQLGPSGDVVELGTKYNVAKLSKAHSEVTCCS